MNYLAWTLFIVGTLLATATGAHSPPLWLPFGVGIALAVSGALLLRRQTAQQAGSGADARITDLAGLRTALHEVTAQTAALEALPEQTDDLLDRLEVILLEQLLPVVFNQGLKQQLVLELGEEWLQRELQPPADADAA